MTLLDRYLLSRCVSTLLKTLIAVVLLFVLIDLLTHRRTDITKHDVPWAVVVQYYLALTPRILLEYQAGAMGILISTLLVLGSLAQHNEMTAIFAGGIGLRRIIVVPVIVAAVVSGLLFLMGETVGVGAARREEGIESRYFARNPDSARPGISWAKLPGDWTCHILKFNREALTGEDVLMLSFRPDAEERIQAKRIFWDPEAEQWLLEDGLWSVFYPARGMEAHHRRITQLPAPLVETPAELFALNDSTATKSAGTLRADILRAQGRRMPVTRLLVDFHGKFSKPFLSFVMVWLAVPFAMRLRRGGLAIGVGMSVIIGLSYLLLFSISQGLGYVGRISPWVAAWLANGTFFLAGLIMTFRTRT